MSDNENLTGEIALVTGASRGIGQAIVLELGRRGATVVGTATSEKGAAAIGEVLAENDVKGAGMMLNVTDQASIDDLMGAMEQFGAPTILVNNAGITRDNLLMRMKDEEWQAIIDTNLTSVYRLSKAVLRGMMKARKGRIVSISSVVGAAGNAGQTNYAAAKAGIIGFTKALALETAAKGITVNCIAPGYVATEMVRAVPEEVLKSRILPYIPVGRLGEPEEVARCVVFLAADEAGFITGSTLTANGGQYLT